MQLWTIQRTWNRVSECHGSGIPEQGTEKEREQTRNQREGTDHSGLSSRLFPYDTDSIRVMVGYGTGNGDTATIEATDMLAVNRFLNHGLAKENGTSNDTVMKHRRERAQNCWKPSRISLTSYQLCRVSIVLMKISSDFKAVEDARGHLQSQPAANVNRN